MFRAISFRSRPGLMVASTSSCPIPGLVTRGCDRLSKIDGVLRGGLPGPVPPIGFTGPLVISISVRPQYPQKRASLGASAPQNLQYCMEISQTRYILQYFYLALN